MTQLTDKIYAVQVPDKFAQITIDPVGPLLMWWSYEGIEDGKLLPPGSYRFLFTTKTATEEDARKVVGEVVLRKIVRYADYTRECMWCETALESLHSLLRGKGLDDKNYALIEKTTNNEAH